MSAFRFSMAWVATAALLGGCVTKEPTTATSARTAAATGFINKTMTVAGKQLAYCTYIPREYDASRKWPLIVFLHGRGERGSDGLLQTDVGIGHAIRENSDRFPCVVVMPQCPGDSGWNERGDIIDEAIARSLAEFNIDKRRIYLTGLSMGGYGTWDYGAKHPELFAALIPICGGGKTTDAPALAKVPIRVFHGGADNIVKPAASRAMVEAVKKAGGNIEYTEYPGVNHNSWDKTYGDPEVIKWLLAQKR